MPRNLVNDMYQVTSYGYKLGSVEDENPYDWKEVGNLCTALSVAEAEWHTSGCGNHVIVTDPNGNVLMELWPTGAEKGWNPFIQSTKDSLKSALDEAYWEQKTYASNR